jgi:hypothetical protein
MGFAQVIAAEHRFGVSLRKTFSYHSFSAGLVQQDGRRSLPPRSELFDTRSPSPQFIGSVALKGIVIREKTTRAQRAPAAELEFMQESNSLPKLRQTERIK